MIHATNNCHFAEELFLSGLGALTLFRGFGRSYAYGRTRAGLVPLLLPIMAHTMVAKIRTFFYYAKYGIVMLK